MYYDFAVQVPSVKGKIISKRKSGSTYILFQYGQDYNAGKKYAISKRTVIGKVHPLTQHACFQMRSSRSTSRMQRCRKNYPKPAEIAAFGLAPMQ